MRRMDMRAAHAQRIDVRQTVMPEIVAVATAAGGLDADGKAKIRATLLHQIEDGLNRRSHRFGLAGEKPMQLSPITIFMRKVIHQFIQLPQHPGLIRKFACADIETQDGKIRHHV